MFQYLWLCGFRFIAHQYFSAFSCQRTLTQYAKSYMANHSQSTGMVRVLNTFGNQLRKNRKRALEICRPFLCHFFFKQYLLSHELDLRPYALKVTRYYSSRQLRNVVPKISECCKLSLKKIFSRRLLHLTKVVMIKRRPWEQKSLREDLELRYLLTAKISPPT